jgi:hypothetical protein
VLIPRSPATFSTLLPLLLPLQDPQSIDLTIDLEFSELLTPLLYGRLPRLPYEVSLDEPPTAFTDYNDDNRPHQEMLHSAL